MSDQGVPPGADPAVPSAARAYDYMLGGKDNYPADRLIVERLKTVVPEMPQVAATNKAFGGRAVRYMAEQGVGQFIDLGSGIPSSPPSVHETARSVRPDARVVYVDHDPVVVAHSDALHALGPGLLTIQRDLRDPDTIYADPELNEIIDWSQPVGVIFLSVLHLVEAEDDPWGVVRRYLEPLAPGSHLAISHLHESSDAQAQATLTGLIKESEFITVAFRSDEEILRFYEGLELADPGLAYILDWRGEEPAPELKMKLKGAVGRKG